MSYKITSIDLFEQYIDSKFPKKKEFDKFDTLFPVDKQIHRQADLFKAD